MTQYILYAWDGVDGKAHERRIAARPAHLKQAAKLKQSRNLLTGGAILNEKKEMIGSMMLVQFENKQELESCLSIEPYIIGNVWQKWECHPFQVASV
ncbi:MAG: YciI family protein [Chitinophagales bacterium]